MTRKILMLYTGGTIGMGDTPAGLAPQPGLLAGKIAHLQPEGCQLSLVEYPDLIDSAEVTPVHWNRLIEDIASRHDQYDGFIVIHGTDTMAYTSSVLAFALQGLAKPVVLTGAQLPLVHARSDGWNNLADAIEAACRPDLQEVVLVFDRVMLRACRVRKVDAAGFHGFDSPNCAPLAEFGIDVVWHTQRWLPSSGPMRVQKLDPAQRFATFFLTPGAAAELFGQFLAVTPLAGAIIMSYGNGNTPADPVLLAGVRAASQRGTWVLNVTQAVRGAVVAGAYAAGQPLLVAGALAGGDLTPEAALAKLAWLCALPVDDAERRRQLLGNCIGEMQV